LDPDPYWIRIGIQPKMLNQGPDEKNANPQPWNLANIIFVTCMPGGRGPSRRCRRGSCRGRPSWPPGRATPARSPGTRSRPDRGQLMLTAGLWIRIRIRIILLNWIRIKYRYKSGSGSASR
jgi:hypothetical protein